jgi:hypothetical protein
MWINKLIESSPSSKTCTTLPLSIEDQFICGSLFASDISIFNLPFFYWFTLKQGLYPETNYFKHDLYLLTKII